MAVGGLGDRVGGALLRPDLHRAALRRGDVQVVADRLRTRVATDQLAQRPLVVHVEVARPLGEPIRRAGAPADVHTELVGDVDRAQVGMLAGDRAGCGELAAGQPGCLDRRLHEHRGALVLGTDIADQRLAVGRDARCRRHSAGQAGVRDVIEGAVLQSHREVDVVDRSVRRRGLVVVDIHPPHPGDHVAALDCRWRARRPGTRDLICRCGRGRHRGERQTGGHCEQHGQHGQDGAGLSLGAALMPADPYGAVMRSAPGGAQKWVVAGCVSCRHCGLQVWLSAAGSTRPLAAEDGSRG